MKAFVYFLDQINPPGLLGGERKKGEAHLSTCSRKPLPRNTVAGLGLLFLLKKSFHPLSTCHVPGSVLSIFLALFHLIIWESFEDKAGVCRCQLAGGFVSGVPITKHYELSGLLTNIYLATPCCFQDLSPLTRRSKLCPLQWKPGVLTTGQPRNSLKTKYLFSLTSGS